MSISRQAKRVADLLKRRQFKVVFAESCTGGLVSGALTQIPGISRFHCGGMVVYRSETKAQWLGIPAEDLKRPGPVSQKVTKLLAEEILRRTPEASISLAVTGHLGPKAPKRLDGVVFFQIALRKTDGTPENVAGLLAQYAAAISRQERQRRAVEDALKVLGDFLETGFVVDEEP
ncbi:MAG TPA: CinA family protein [Pirellulaceae bacterium]|nr:CinA family protein [Pirellulaceae bacterium]